MTDVATLQAALVQLRGAVSEIDTSAAPELGLCINVLANAVAAAGEGVNAAVVNDIDFAMNDVNAAIDELPQADADRLATILTTLRKDVAALKAATALDRSLIAAIRTFQSKLRERLKAIERQTYVEGEAEPLPHPPEALREEAIPLARQLVTAGFATPALDTLMADPSSLRFHSIREILDELDVVIG
jgi:hypothetical protein